MAKVETAEKSSYCCNVPSLETYEKKGCYGHPYAWLDQKIEGEKRIKNGDQRDP